MTKQENRQQTHIDDLPVPGDEAAEVKGGPLEIRELHIKVHVEPER